MKTNGQFSNSANKMMMSRHLNESMAVWKKNMKSVILNEIFLVKNWIVQVVYPQYLSDQARGFFF